jgi:hypothetical protein
MPDQQEPPISDPVQGGLVYLASPYSHHDPTVVESRFEAVCREAARLMADGLHIYSPIAHTHPIAMRGALPTDWAYWEAYDTAIISRCTELRVLKLDGWDTSRGVSAEMQIADSLGIPITFEEVSRDR